MLLNASHPINQIVDQPAGRIRGYQMQTVNSLKEGFVQTVKTYECHRFFNWKTAVVDIAIICACIHLL